MNQMEFEIAGVSFRLECEKELVPEERLLPFLTDGIASPDFVYRIVSGNFEPNRKAIYSCPDMQIFFEDGKYYRVQKRSLYGKWGWICTGCLDEGRNYRIVCSEEFFESETVMKNLEVSFYMALEENLLKKDAFYLHASCVCFHENAVLFTAPSGTGKSTQAGLWENCFQAEIINGDRTIVRREADGWYASGSPYAGSSRIYKNRRVKIRAIIVLEQNSENVLRRLFGAAAFSALYRETLMNTWNAEYMETVSELLLSAARQIPMYHFACRPDYAAAEMVKEALFHETGEEGGGRIEDD